MYNGHNSSQTEVRLMKKFNVTGTCIPDRHYMVDITGKLEKIKALIDDGRNKDDMLAEME